MDHFQTTLSSREGGQALYPHKTEQQEYADYTRYLERIGVAPATFPRWLMYSGRFGDRQLPPLSASGEPAEC